MSMLGGLIGKDVPDFVKQVFEQADIDEKNLPREYLDLLNMLDGHPLSLRVVLPRLKHETSKELIQSKSAMSRTVEVQ